MLSAAKHRDDAGWVAPMSWNVCIPELTYATNASEIEDLGGEVQYRCMRCRHCNDCRKSEVIERISLKEEAEQLLYTRKRMDLLRLIYHSSNRHRSI